ncbi:Yip1 family protein [Photobacterium aphoticum]|uniref:Membrane protein n=1 Tax=Photobacterium aphoticum TaxID=754436 RepID=A0A090QW69_9GAMM|nr:Yip1 family protein [Photobacterium aphoticum]KLU98573.1 membrane protein [Photobacterium aphoticum]PSU55687.1 YIP1 family protein [Photobacterium aphoticum]GAL07430.1 inner membrane protein Yip1 [Photobacterium aphoticum]GHA38673.1 YIP1 family protein [Photobacterium aphoticum]
MILGHLFGLYAHPKQEWRTIDKEHEGIHSSLSHILLIALFPPTFAFLSSVLIGWRIGVGAPIFLTPSSAFAMSVAMYFALIGGVFALAYLTYWMSHTFGSSPTYTQALELAAYTATPLFMASMAAVFPHVWFLMLIGLLGVAYSVYLLYTGVPILMHIPEERGFIYASSIVTGGLVLLVAIIAGSVILWNVGIGPEFMH